MKLTRDERLLRLARLRGDRLAIAVLEGRQQPQPFHPSSLADYVLFVPRRRAA